VTCRSVLSFLVIAWAAGLHGQSPVFRSHVDAVRVDVLVARDGRPVAGLTGANFELRDSGVVQRIEAISVENVPLFLQLTLDTSSSLRGESIEHLKSAARGAIATLAPADRAALLTFNHVLKHESPWTDDFQAVARAIDTLESYGTTALHDAAFASVTMRENTAGRVLVLLFSDGVDTGSWLSPLAVLEQARRSDVVVIPVSLDTSPRASGPEAARRAIRRPPLAEPGALRRWFREEPTLFRHEFLAALADETGGELVVADSSNDLRSMFMKIVESFKTRYVLTYSPQGVPPSGWHPIEVRLRNVRGEVLARRGYIR